MPRPQSPIHCPPRAARLPLPWEPAQTQLRELPAVEIHRLVGAWLDARGLAAPRVREHHRCVTTYETALVKSLLCLPVGVRVYQRKNRLQVHHIDAFAGYLARRGIPSGLLITTGECSRDALRVAHRLPAPRIHVIAGDQWLAELAVCRTGVRRRGLWRWIVDLTRLRATAPVRPLSPSEEMHGPR